VHTTLALSHARRILLVVLKSWSAIGSGEPVFAALPVTHLLGISKSTSTWKALCVLFMYAGSSSPHDTFEINFFNLKRP
jgi:hypothetical protein